MRVEEAGPGLWTVKLGPLLLPVAIYDLELARDSYTDAITIHEQQDDHDSAVAVHRKLEAVAVALDQCSRADPDDGCSLTAPTWLVGNIVHQGATVSVEALGQAMRELERSVGDEATLEQVAAVASASESVTEWVRTVLAVYELSPS